MKKIISICLILSLFGCADRKNLLNILFPSCLAIDYDNNEYEIALQLDNLNSVAKTELASGNEDTRLLVATGKGKTIEEAILDIEQSERSVIDLSHIKSIILRPNILKEPILSQFINFATYHPELRKDSEIYYTEDNYVNLFSTSFQLSRNELYVLINSNEYQHISMIMDTIHLMQLIKAHQDVNITIHIPILKVIDSKDTYITKEGEDSQKIYDIEEVLYISKEKQARINIRDLEGLQWVKTHLNNVEINISDDLGEISGYANRVQAFLYYHPKDQLFYLKGEVNLVITRDSAFRKIEEIEPIVNKKVHEQIMHTYLQGLRQNIDIYNIAYQPLIFHQEEALTETNFINDLDIKIQIKGSYVGH